MKDVDTSLEGAVGPLERPDSASPAASNAVRVSVMVVGIVLALVGLPLRLKVTPLHALVFVLLVGLTVGSLTGRVKQFLLALLIAVLLVVIVAWVILATGSWGPTPPPSPG